MNHLSQPLALTDSLIFTGETFVENHALLLKAGQIVDLCPNRKIPSDFTKHSYPHHILSAGFIDCQVNGGGNVLLNATPTVQAVHKIAAAHRKTGTTSLLPTCITDRPQIIGKAIEAVREARKTDTSILGIHIEGPHINKSFKGTHNDTFIRPLIEQDIQLYQKLGDEIFMLTLAPEVVGAELIGRLVAQGLIVSLGHTTAQREDILAALAVGATGFTHLYTRMVPITSREPGPVGIALDDKSSWVGMICDNVHLAPELVRIAVRAKATDKLFMVSDAAAPAGAEKPQPFDWNGIKVYPKENMCLNEEGVLAGALLTLGQCVPIAIRDIRLDPDRVLRMASTIPAAFLGLGDRLGKLLPNYGADIVAMDHSFKTVAVWKDGIKIG